MADTVASGVQASDTDYKFESLTQGFIARSEAAANAMTQRAVAAADAFQKLMTDAQANATIMLQGMGMMHGQWLGGFSQLQAAITANAVSQLNASSADSTLNLIKVGAALSNSASPPVPAYQNLGTNGPGQGTMGNVVLPKGSTVTVPAT